MRFLSSTTGEEVKFDSIPAFLSSEKAAIVAILVMSTLKDSRPLICPSKVPKPPSHNPLCKIRVPPSTSPPYKEVHRLLLAIKAVHSAGYVHLDIKPGNVVINGTDLLLLDFGLSTRVAEVRRGSERSDPQWGLYLFVDLTSLLVTSLRSAP